MATVPPPVPPELADIGEKLKEWLMSVMAVELAARDEMIELLQSQHEDLAAKVQALSVGGVPAQPDASSQMLGISRVYHLMPDDAEGLKLRDALEAWLAAKEQPPEPPEPSV